MEYFIPIEFITIVDLIDRINEIAVDIQKDILQYNLLSTSLKRKDTKRLVYHHLIKGLCDTAVRKNFNNVFFVYSPHRLSFTKLNSLFIDPAADSKIFLEEFIKICQQTIGLEIFEYVGGAKKFYEDYNQGSATVITMLAVVREYVKSNKKKQLSFFEKYGLKYLYENHFKNMNYLILTTKS